METCIPYQKEYRFIQYNYNGSNKHEIEELFNNYICITHDDRLSIIRDGTRYDIYPNDVVVLDDRDNVFVFTYETFLNIFDTIK